LLQKAKQAFGDSWFEGVWLKFVLVEWLCIGDRSSTCGKAFAFPFHFGQSFGPLFHLTKVSLTSACASRKFFALSNFLDCL